MSRDWNGTTDNLAHSLPFPIGAQIIGWAVVIVILLPIPIFCIMVRSEIYIYLSSLQSSKTQYSTMPGNFGSPFAL